MNLVLVQTHFKCLGPILVIDECELFFTLNLASEVAEYFTLLFINLFILHLSIPFSC